MINTCVFNVFLCVLLSLSLSGRLLAGQVYYVYEDPRGRTHIVDSIPGDAIKFGYKIVNDKGVTIREVPSLASQIKKARVEARLSKAQRAKNAQRERNERLLRRFTSLEDIRETGNKKILALQTQIDITNNYIKSYKKNLRLLESQADALNNRLEPVPDDDLRAIERLKENIRKNLQYVDQRRLEQHKVRDEFLALIEDYKKLTKKK
ncbi:MAG TPA: hypothetical protein ENK06_12855 [Gammaproteobacteria bacterium]|nr:hypothetical protein [Gammaproteobacteria bacterium]